MGKAKINQRKKSPENDKNNVAFYKQTKDDVTNKQKKGKFNTSGPNERNQSCPSGK